MQSRILVLFDWWWSHQLNYSGATDVLGREMSLISSAIFGLKHHSPDKTIYLGHGSFASASLPTAGASICMHSYCLASTAMPYSPYSSEYIEHTALQRISDLHSCLLRLHPQKWNLWLQVRLCGTQRHIRVENELPWWLRMSTTKEQL